MTQRSRTTFGDLVSVHLRELGWSQKDLAHYADLPAASICGWLSGQPNPDRKHVNKIAFTLAMGYDRKRRSDYNSSKLDILLNQLLEAVGLAAIVGAPKESIWIRLAHQEPEDRTLVAGWVNYPYFSYGEDV